MTSISRMPGDWPLEITEDYYTEQLFLNPDYVRPERRKTPPATPYSPLPSLDNDGCTSRSSSSNLDHAKLTQWLINSHTSPMIPNKPFVLGSGLPAAGYTALNAASSLSSPIARNGSSIPQNNFNEFDNNSSAPQNDPNKLLVSRRSSQIITMSNPTDLQTTSLSQTQEALHLTATTIDPCPEDLSLQLLPPSAQDEFFIAFGARNAPPINSLRPFYDENANELTSENPKWIMYEPPNELLRTQNVTSVEINNIILPSIQRVRDREIREEVRHNAAQAETTLARLNVSSHTVAKPIRIPVLGSMDPLQGSEQSNESNEMNAPPHAPSSPENSGYGTSPEIETRDSVDSVDTSQSLTARKFTGLSGLFKRKTRSRKEVDLLSVNQGSDNQDSSFSRPASSPSLDILAQDRSTGECVSCLEDFPRPQLVNLTCHSYCAECFQGLIKTALETETHWPAKCCLNIIPSVKILSNLDSKSQIRYKQREAEWSIPVGDRVYCSRQTCGAWIAPKNVNKATNSAKCNQCGRKSCLMCHGKFHNGNECPQDRGVQATLELAELEGWKRCYRCSALVEHNQGCRHMTCRCKAEFCYICSAKWRTCACTDRDLEGVRQRAANNRQNQEANIALAAAEARLLNQANAREVARLAAIEEEERQILLEVENYIRAEAEREIREAEEARLAMEAERQRREEERLAAIHVLFQRLHEEFDRLGWMQLNSLNERHEHESEALQEDHRRTLDTIAISHEAEIEAQIKETEQKVTDFQFKLIKEYETRRAEERRVENKYVDELRAFWTGKQDAEYKIRAARDELRSERAQDYRYWKSYRRAQLNALEDGEGKKMALLMERHETEARAVGEKSKADALELKKKNWSEKQWFVEVSMERRAMLEELQVQEYAKA